MASRLKLERIRKDLSQANLAALTLNRVDQPRLSLLERGVRPREEEAAAISEALGLSIRELWPELAGG